MQEHINSAAERRDAPLSEKIETEELALLIAVAVDRMPEQRRRVFSLSRYEELSNKEIAERLNLSVKTVERHMTAALSQLRRLLTPRPLRLKTRPKTPVRRRLPKNTKNRCRVGFAPRQRRLIYKSISRIKTAYDGDDK